MKAALIISVYLAVLAQYVNAAIIFPQWKRGTEADLEQFKRIMGPANVTGALIVWRNARGESQSKDLPIKATLSIVNTVSETDYLDVQEGSYSKEDFVATMFVKWSNKEDKVISLEIASGGRIFLSYLINGKPASGNSGFWNPKLVDTVRAVINELRVSCIARKGNSASILDMANTTQCKRATVKRTLIDYCTISGITKGL
jgi:hypothetical protein